jgi:hypothetical protein
VSKEEECVKNTTTYVKRGRYNGRKTKIKYEGDTVCRKPGF